MADTGISSQAFVAGASVIGAAIAVFTGVGAGVGEGIAAGKGAEAVARQPEAQGNIIAVMLIGDALAETTAIYGFVISLLLLFANPFFSKV